MNEPRLARMLFVRGQKALVPSRWRYRYAVVSVREEDRKSPEGTYVAFANVVLTRESPSAARLWASSYEWKIASDVAVVVIDRLTGEEI